MPRLQICEGASMPWMAATADAARGSGESTVEDAIACCCGDRDRRARRGRPKRRYFSLVDGCVGYVDVGSRWGRRRGRMRRTPEFIWSLLYGSMGDDEPRGMLGAAVARAEPQILRLSLTYALADGADEINEHHLGAAWAMWRYCRASAEWIFGNSTGDPIADRLFAAVRDAGPTDSTSPPKPRPTTADPAPCPPHYRDGMFGFLSFTSRRPRHRETGSAWCSSLSPRSSPTPSRSFGH
jgi:hypothetical protein